jgi:hypothetical protein
VIGAPSNIMLSGIVEQESGVAPSPPSSSVRAIVITLIVMLVLALALLLLVIFFAPPVGSELAGRVTESPIARSSQV